MIAKSVVVALASEARAGAVEERNSEPIERVNAKILRIEMKVQVAGWDDIQPVTGMRETEGVESR